MVRVNWDIGQLLMAYTRNGKRRAVRVMALRRTFRCNSEPRKVPLDGLNDNSLAEHVISWRARREWQAVAGQEFFGRSRLITRVDELSPDSQACFREAAAKGTLLDYGGGAPPAAAAAQQIEMGACCWRR